MWHFPLFRIVQLLGDSYLYAVLPVYYAEAGISLVAVGWLLSVNRWIRFASNPAAGAIGRRIGWGWAFAGAMWLGALSTAAYGLVKGLLLLSVARALWGITWSFLRLGGLAAVLADTPAGRRGKAMGLGWQGRTWRLWWRGHWPSCAPAGCGAGRFDCRLERSPSGWMHTG